MLIAGAGGHALEVLEVWKELEPHFQFIFFDEINTDQNLLRDIYPICHHLEEVKAILSVKDQFSLGVGSPEVRRRLYGILCSQGGTFSPLHAASAQVSSTASGEFDAMPFSFIGPDVQIGQGSLINTRAHVHHECYLGEFVEVGPGAVLLGNVHVGSYCSIGAGAVLLPGINLGNHIRVGAGAVVTRDFHDGATVKGIPAKI